MNIGDNSSLEVRYKELIRFVLSDYINSQKKYTIYSIEVLGDIKDKQYKEQKVLIPFQKDDYEQIKKDAIESLEIFEDKSYDSILIKDTVEYFLKNPKYFTQALISIWYYKRNYNEKNITYIELMKIYNYLIKNYALRDIHIENNFEEALIIYSARQLFNFLSNRDKIHRDFDRSGKSKVLGEGTFGKVYKPPYEFDDDDQVGKIFTKYRNWEFEYNIGEKLRKIDKSGFLVLPERINEKNKEILQLRYGYAGISYKKYLRNIPNLSDMQTISKITENTINIMCAFIDKYLTTFGKSKLVHLDIKPDNVMYLESDNELKLIDFSLVTEGRYIFDRKIVGISYSIDKLYPYYSPELNMHFSHTKPDDLYLESTKIRFIRNMTSIFRTIFFKKICDEAINKNIRAFWDGEDYKDTSKFHAQDAWSIGITFLLYFEIILHRYENEWNVNNISSLFKTHHKDKWNTEDIRTLYINNNEIVNDTKWNIENIASMYEKNDISYRSIPDMIKHAINIIVNNLLCLNIKRDLLKCRVELQRIKSL